MHPISGAPLLVAALALAALLPAANAQSPLAAADAATPDGAPAPRESRKRVERLHTEDAGTRIDELRYGGETQSITVQPKSGAPEYEVIPFDGARQRQQIRRDNDVGSGPSGQRVWKVFGF